MRRRYLLTALAWLLPAAAFAQAAPPAEIKLGTLYAGSGTYASISMPVHDGLKIWVDQVNAAGGAFVKTYNKKIPIKLIAYDDASSTATAATLYNQLITQDKVDVLLSDSGSVLVSVGVPIAREHKMFLFNQTGTGATLFNPDNPYIALISSPGSTYWPRYIGEFVTGPGAKAGVKKVAILYSTNDFTATQASTMRAMIKKAGNVEIVYDQGVPTSTSNYTTLISNIAAASPDAVLAFGYPNNDIAFLRALGDSGEQFKMVFTLYSGLERDEVAKAAGAKSVDGVFTYVPAANIDYKPDFGLTLPQYRAIWDKAYPNGEVGFGVNAVAGYNSGQIVEKVLGTSDSMAQLDLRKALFALSGKIKTMMGPFELDSSGAQMGQITPVGQLAAEKDGVKLTVVYPPELAQAQPRFGK